MLRRSLRTRVCSRKQRPGANPVRQIGIRGYWPGPKEFDWQASRGITSLFIHDVRQRGIEAVVGEALSVQARPSSRSTSTSSIRRSRREPGRRSPAA